MSIRLPFAPWAFTICSNFLNAFPESRISFARIPPLFFSAILHNSKIFPARNIDFSLKSCGPSPFSTEITSLISRIGPIPLPIGWFPSVRTHFNFILNIFPSFSNVFFSFSAPFLLTFALVP